MELKSHLLKQYLKKNEILGCINVKMSPVIWIHAVVLENLFSNGTHYQHLLKNVIPFFFL